MKSIFFFVAALACAALLPTATAQIGNVQADSQSGLLNRPTNFFTNGSNVAQIQAAVGSAFQPLSNSLTQITNGTWAGASSITTVGAIASGAWLGSVVSGQYGGTGVVNTGKTLTLGGNLTTSGSFGATIRFTGVTDVTMPTSGNLTTTGATLAAYQGNYIVSGDSNSEPTGAHCGGPENVWFKVLQSYPFFANAHAFVNTAASGRTISDLITNYTAEVHPYAPAITGLPCQYLILIGTNDANAGTSSATMISQLATLIGLAATDNIGVWLITEFSPQPIHLASSSAAANGLSIRTFNNAIRLNRSAGVLNYIDAATLFPDAEDTTYFVGDGTHINALGQAVLAQNVALTISGRAGVPFVTYNAFSQGANGTVTRPASTSASAHTIISYDPAALSTLELINGASGGKNYRLGVTGPTFGGALQGNLFLYDGTSNALIAYWDASNNYAFHAAGALLAGTGPTTVTDAAGKVLSAALNTVAVGQGGTGLTSGTSGGVPYFSASSTIASSAALAANSIVIGGGAGAAPATTTTGAGVIAALAVAANGSGGFVTDTGTVTITNKRITARITTITSSATPTVNTDNCDCVTIAALAAAITSMTTNLSGTPSNFDQLEYRIKDDGTARAITWGTSFVSGPATLPTTTTVSKALHVWFEWDSVQSKWVCVSTGSDA